MRPQVNIAIVVNVIGALSARSLGGGNLCMMDDGDLGSTGLGGPDLRTVCQPGQLVTWEVVALDVQTPVEISSITFLGAAAPPAFDRSTETAVWSGILPVGLMPGTVFPYRLELRMSEGDFSLLHIDTPALAIAGSGPAEGALT